MPGGIAHRASSPFMQKFRELLRGGPINNALRFEDFLAPRTLPPPDVPGGPYHKTSKIYYYARDGRREVAPPPIVSTAKQIGTGSEVSKDVKAATPGKIYHWDC